MVNLVGGQKVVKQQRNISTVLQAQSQPRPKRFSGPLTHRSIGHPSITLIPLNGGTRGSTRPAQRQQPPRRNFIRFDKKEQKPVSAPAVQQTVSAPAVQQTVSAPAVQQTVSAPVVKKLNIRKANTISLTPGAFKSSSSNSLSL
jgi:hypothetical protein